MEKKETVLVRFFYVFSTISTYRSSYTHKLILRVKVKSESHAQQRRYCSFGSILHTFIRRNFVMYLNALIHITPTNDGLDNFSTLSLFITLRSPEN